MKIYLSIHGHTNSESLPLRFGMQIKESYQQFVNLENGVFDEVGTNRQRADEIERGNKHYLGDLCIPNIDKTLPSHCYPCRVVLGAPKYSDQAPPIVTILRQDYSHGDLTVTKHISGMLKRGRISVDDIINFLHPKYLIGEIQDSNDIEEIYSNEILPSRQHDLVITSVADEAIVESADHIKSAIDSFSIEEVNLHAPPTFVNIELGEKVKYQYVMADAFINDAWMAEDKIWIEVVSSNGTSKKLHSFKPRNHLAQHHKLAYDYLQSRIGQRAYFAVCNSEPCKGFLAESVTSIALQLMKKQ